MHKASSHRETPIFCHPFQPKDDLAAWLRSVMQEAHDFDPRRNVIQPAESKRFSLSAVRERRQILLNVYHSDYHTDSFDDERLAKRVEQGDELIWFWGAEREIDKLRHRLHNGINSAERIYAGTVTVLSAEEICGPGYGELCRSGSIDRELHIKFPAVLRTLHYLSGEEKELSARYHTLMLSARNRTSTAEVRGGEAVQRLHSYYLRSRFWGFAPWYVMEGGGVEQLDYRESNRAPQDVLNAFCETPVLWLPDEAEAQFVEALCRLNLDIAPKIKLLRRTSNLPTHSAYLAPLPPPELRPYNPAWIALGSRASDCNRIESLVQFASHEQACCIVVRVRIDEPDEAQAQVWLKSQQFKLNAILPPKRVRNGQLDYVPASALWCRTRPGTHLIPPHYSDRATENDWERIILSYRRLLMN